MLDRSPGSARDHVGYHDLTQAALRAVVRAAMAKAVKLGCLPGDHHFYVTFRTRLQGVQMSDDLKDKFPDEMTIVIQHQYYDFHVHDDSFEVVLKFGGQSQKLHIPFQAITRFVDPSVNFGVQLDTDSRPVDADVVLPLAASQPEAAAQRAAGEPAEGTVVSLDAFRRK
ncbi:MAG: ClpXP protease specificity-enhancing factor SspB [Hyphomonadaceae bacterium]